MFLNLCCCVYNLLLFFSNYCVVFVLWKRCTVKSQYDLLPIWYFWFRWVYLKVIASNYASIFFAKVMPKECVNNSIWKNHKGTLLLFCFNFVAMPFVLQLSDLMLSEVCEFSLEIQSSEIIVIKFTSNLQYYKKYYCENK